MANSRAPGGRAGLNTHESYSLREAPVWQDPGPIVFKPSSVVELLSTNGDGLVAINADLNWLCDWLVEISERAPRW